MIRVGLRLRWFGEGHPDYTLGDLVAFIGGLDRSSAFVRAQVGEDAHWGLAEDLLALMNDQFTKFRWDLSDKKGDPPTFVSRYANTPPEQPAYLDAPEPDLNDDNIGGEIVAQVRTTEEIARDLGWA